MGSLSDKLEYLLDTKEQLKQALIDKNVDIDENTTFRNFAIKTTDNTNLVDTSDATAMASDILPNKTAYVNGQKLTGNIQLLGDSISFNLYDRATIRKLTDSVIEIGTINLKNVYATNSNIVAQIKSSLIANAVNLTADKLISGNNILGINGTAIELVGQTKTITPTTTQQILIPDQEYNALTSVTIEPVTASIDSNIVAENIKNGVSILGVTGTLEEGIDTSDANATASDIADGKTAYVNGQKITGNVKDLNQNLPYSGLFQDTTVQYVKIGNSLKVRTRTNRNILVREWTPRLEVDVRGSSIAQEIGLSADKLKKDEVVLGVTGTYEGEKAVLPDGVRFYTTTATNMDWLADVDTSQITSFSGFIRNCRQITSLPYFDTSNGTNFSQMCESARALVSFPQIDTSNGTNFYIMFQDCKALVDVPVLDWSKATTLENVFGGFGSGGQAACTNLSNESLNNILEMCANATAYIQQGTNMTLSYIGLTQTQTETCQTLSNWDAFVAAGWTSGY